VTVNLSHIDVTVKDAGEGKGHGEFEAILSAPTLDRDGEVVAPKAFDPLPESIVIHVDHAFGVKTAVARAVPRYEGDLLLARGFFGSDPDSQAVRQKVKDGIITTMSVGFMNAKREDVDGVPHVIKGELLEASFVSVPSNREALVLAAKAANFGDDETQKMHDLAVANGAACDHKTPDAQSEPVTDPEKDAAPAASKSPADVAALIAARAQADAASVL
jgi:HK97 family phage prohead protease